METQAAQLVTKKILLPFFHIYIEINPVTILTSWIVICILISFAIIIKIRLRRFPGRLQVAFELLIDWFDKTMKEGLREDARKFLPLVVTLFLFVTLSNWTSTIPRVSSPTKDLNTCLGLGLLVFFVSHISAIKKKGLKGYISAYFKPYWFLFPSNVISEIGKVISHSFRLFGNIFAGGVVIAVVPQILITIFKFFGVPLGIVSMPFLYGFFGLFIGLVQAFVFSLLALVYITVLRQD